VWCTMTPSSIGSVGTFEPTFYHHLEMAKEGGELAFELHRLVSLGDVVAVKELLEAHYERRPKGKLHSFILSWKMRQR